MKWNKGFSSKFYIEKVDPTSWRDIERMEVVGGSIVRTTDDLLQSADLDMTEMPGECYVRVYLEATQGDTSRVALFTGLTSAPSRDINGSRESYKVECYSVLKPAEDVLLQRGYYVPAQFPIPKMVEKLLSVCDAPIEVADETYPTLDVAVVAEDGETNLSLAETILDEIGWELVIDGDGTIHIQPPCDDVVAVFDALENDVIEMQVTESNDWFSCPNVFRAVSDDMEAVARDDSATSKLSTVNRGREIWAEETGVSLSDDESLAAYALRRLNEEQAVSRTVSYDRRFHPNVNVGSVVQIHHPSIGIDSTFRVSEQSFDLSHGCRTSEDAEEI